MIKKNKILITLILLHVFIIIVGVLSIIILPGWDYNDILLRDDGYYDIAKGFVNGGSLLHRSVGPVLPLIFSVIHIFPPFLHPFIRLLIALSFSIGTIIILYNITKDYITEKQFFWGSLFFIFNPIYNHFILKSTPEIYLAFCLGLFIFLLLKYYKTGTIKYLMYSMFIFILSVLLKPVFLLIPFLLLFSTIFTKSKKVLFTSIIFIFLSISGYLLFDKITDVKYENNIEKTLKNPYDVARLFITDTFWTDYVIKTKRFHNGNIKRYQPNSHKKNYNFGGSIDEMKTATKWMKNFFNKYPNRNSLFMILYFIYDKPFLVLQKLLVSPILFFSMSSRPVETCIMLIVSGFSIFFSILGIRTIMKNSKIKKEILLIISTIIGFSSIFFISISYVRYSLPILPFLYVWSGIPISNKIYKYLKR